MMKESTRGRWAVVALAWVLGLSLSLPAGAADDHTTAPDDGGVIKSMGQPPTLMPYLGLGAGVYKPAGNAKPTGRLTLGLFKNVASPIASIGLAAEGYVGPRGTEPDGGVRGLLAVKPLHFATGVDYNIKDGDPDFLLSLTHSLRRGGPFGRGGRFRVDYLPTRKHSVQVSLVIPFGQGALGKTRPRKDHASIWVPKDGRQTSPSRPTAADPALEETLAHVRDAADWMNRYATPFFDPAGGTREESMERFAERVKKFKAHMAERSALYPDGRGYPEEIRVYHQELDRAFSQAVGDAAAGYRPGASTAPGQEISAAAREILLGEVILPYNRFLGRTKKPDTTIGFAAKARSAFELWMNRQTQIPATRRPALRHVMQTVLDAIEENRAGSVRYWETSELVWIPVHLAMRPEQLQTEKQIDAILERAVEEPFSEGNDHHYVINEKFQWELLRHIKDAESYHVLWIHDYRGLNTVKELDELGFDQVYHGYLQTMIERVRLYDTTGTLPVYMIFLDQNFYEPNRGRLWMSFLEDPLDAKITLPDGPAREDKEAAIRKAQQELREAVAASALLQERARAYGDDWLRNRIKVHVNITNPVDWSFWSQRVIPVLGLPDVMMRDHRKISFFDVTENDPDSGEAIFTGMGVGEHYAGPTWEDRAILATGPSLVSLKTAARQLLLNQGFEPDEIPYPLRPLPTPPDHADLVEARVERGLRFRSMQIHNQTGYAPKMISVAKALLYDVMPAGSVIIVPDSLWNSPFWAGMLVGQALRGGRVFVITPGLDNAPSAGFPQMSRAQEIFSELIMIQQMLGDELKAVGGAVHTGIYAAQMDVGDLAARTAAVYDNAPNNPLTGTFRGIEPDGPEWPALLEGLQQRKAKVLASLAEMGFEAGYVAKDVDVRRPKLHLKAQILLNEAAVRILRKVRYTEIVDAYMTQRARQVSDEYVNVHDLWIATNRLWAEEARRVHAIATPEDREAAAGYLAVGSHNMDYRGLLMDGEVLYITTGTGVLPGIIDLFIITGLSTWVDDLEELEALLPAYSEWQRRIGRFMKYAL